MGSSKENLIFILDVRQINDENFKQNCLKCCADVIKQKICSGRKDDASFILVGTQCTKNNLSVDPNDGYANICQYGKQDDCVLYPLSWQLLINFYQFIDTTTTSKYGDWLEALVVAMNLIKLSGQSNTVKRSRIILFYNFSIGQNVYDDYDLLTENIIKHDMTLIVVSPDIVYIDNEDAEQQPRVIFFPNKQKSNDQLENEKYALALISSCNAVLCNFTEALNAILMVKNKRPWSWNCQLRIGTQISIAVSGIIKAKNESTINLCTTWNEPSEKLIREWGYYINGNQIKPEEDTLIDGYMLGGTAIPYDEVNNDTINKLKLSKGLTFMGFIPLNLVYDEYFNGDSTYLLLHQRGKAASAKKMDALVRILFKRKRAILCWKVYSEKLNKAKVVALIPNPPNPDCPASFKMLEMAHHAQYHFFEFPKLTTKNTECSDEQLDAIDNLIDSMDLTFSPKGNKNKPRETIEKDYLPFDHLRNIFEYNIVNVIERKIIEKASEEHARFKEVLDDKNFVDKFWKLPEAIEEEAKEAAKTIKKVFPLYTDPGWLKKLPKNKINSAQTSEAHYSDHLDNLKILSPIDIGTLKWKNPAKDFDLLLHCNVFSIKDHSKRDFEFEHISVTYSNIIWQLIFGKDGENIKNHNINALTEAIRIFRKHCFNFNAFNLYNKWITQVKSEIRTTHLKDFWQKVIVQNNLGLCFIGVLSTEESLKMKEFYNI